VGGGSELEDLLMGICEHTPGGFGASSSCPKCIAALAAIVDSPARLSRLETDQEAEERFASMQEEVARLRRDLEATSRQVALLLGKEVALSWMVEYCPCESDEGACGECVPCRAGRVLDGDLTALVKAEGEVCAHEWELDRSCGAQVCVVCGAHDGIVRCFCGWSRSGRDGAAELREMGEEIDDG